MAYNPPRPHIYSFDPKSKNPYRLSRTGLENFVRCPRCFYLDKRLGIGQPPTPSFTLNKTVDYLLKKEFDIHRAKNTTHPLLKHYNLKAKPVSHDKLNDWRDTFKGVSFLHKPTNIEFYGAIDDLWIDDRGNYIAVDYKATSKDGKIDLDSVWQQSYKRQLEIYQWLLRRNKLKVSDTGYFVYCNAQRDRAAFDGKLEFSVELVPHHGDDSWVEKTLIESRKCLKSNKIPEPAKTCDYCKYRQVTRNFEAAISDKKSGKMGTEFNNGKLF